MGAIHLYAQEKTNHLLNQFKMITDDSVKVDLALDLYYEFHRTDINQSLYYAKLAESIALKNNYKKLLWKSKLRKGEAYKNLGEFSNAITSFEDLIFLLQNKTSDDIYVSAKISLAKIYQNLQDYDKAKDLYIEALKISQQTNNENAEARIYNYLGSLHRSLDQPELAYDDYDHALKIVKDLNFKPGISACLTNLGLVSFDLSQYEMAQDFYEQAIPIKKELNDELGLIRVYINLISLYNRTGEKQLAEHYLTVAYEQSKHIENTDLVCSVLFNFAEFEFNNGRLEASRDRLLEILKNKDLIDDSKIISKTYSILAKTYEGLGQYDDAYNILIDKQRVDENLASKKIELATNEIEAKYKNQQKTKELELLSSKSEVQELMLRQRTQERNVTIILVIVFFVIMLLLYNFLRAKQKNNLNLLELDRAKSNFFANISHEFRTPLTLILNPLAQVINRDQVDEKDLSNLNLVKTNADRLLVLIDQLLDLSKIEAKKYTIKVSNCNISEYLMVISESFAFKAEEKDITFNVNIENQIQNGWIDKNAIERIVINLLSNAIKYTPKGGVVDFNSKIRNDTLTLTITNSGDGIPNHEQSKIFDRFYQRNNHSDGFGIGLSLVKELVELHKGKIELNSEEKAWTLFKIEIPIAVNLYKKTDLVDFDKTKALSDSKNSNLIQNSKKPVILIVDDNKDIGAYIERLFSKEYMLIVSDNGDDAFKMASQYIPELIISDIMMPKLNGVEFCKKIKNNEATCHIPIILLSAKAGEENITEGIKAGAEDYIIKPFNDVQLKNKVNNIIESRRKMIAHVSMKHYTIGDSIEGISKLDQRFLKKMKSILKDNLCDASFGASEFSSAIGMSRMQLHRKLKAVIGLSTSEFLRAERLKLAAKLLLKTDARISEIGYQVGFNNHPYFSKAFKDYYHCSPSEYLNAHK